MELPINSQSAHISRKIKLVRHIRAVQDEIKCKRKRLSPVLITRRNEMISAELESFGFLQRVRKARLRAPSALAQRNTEMAESSDSKDCNFLAGPQPARTRGE